jgi:hypothetical protein
MYARKTQDLYIVQGLYAGNWEDECAELTRKEAILRLNEYRENAPEYCYKLVKKREKLNNEGA